MSVDEMYYILLDEFHVSKETINIIVSINGYSKKTMNAVLNCVSQYKNFKEYEED